MMNGSYDLGLGVEGRKVNIVTLMAIICILLRVLLLLLLLLLNPKP